ncbi:MAG TPA: PilW family protein [Steroidobacteraceae bacterium]|nr:PilW family protein [Steroidobacteraceae bacterium]
MSRTPQSVVRRATQRGFSIVELSIAMLIALFLLGGLVTLVMGTRRTSSTQTALEQLQDNERIAMTLIANVVQKAGYFPNPVTQQLSSFNAETLAGVTMASSQVLGGTYSAAAPGDRFAVRFYTPSTDPNSSIINCAGQSNPAPSSAPNPNLWYTNVFKVGTVNGTKWLQCQVRSSGAGTVITVNLIPNVTSISVLYGVSSGAVGTDYSVVRYLNASQMTAANWLNVTAMKVTLTFLLPAYGTTGGQMMSSSAPNSTQTFQRVIPIMSRAGVDT